jgi:hypothetical protein
MTKKDRIERILKMTIKTIKKQEENDTTKSISTFVCHRGK